MQVGVGVMADVVFECWFGAFFLVLVVVYRDCVGLCRSVTVVRLLLLEELCGFHGFPQEFWIKAGKFACNRGCAGVGLETLTAGGHGGNVDDVLGTIVDVPGPVLLHMLLQTAVFVLQTRCG